MKDDLFDSLAALVSEGRNPETMNIDALTSLELVTKLCEQDAQVVPAVAKELGAIAQAVDWISAGFMQGGRLIYVGAGTSGRLGVLDASECPPTFGVSENMVVGLIAGGKDAMFRAQEGVEDSTTQGAQDLCALQLSKADVVVGIAASGRTPYVIGALEYAAQQGVKTVGLSCNPESMLAKVAALSIAPIVGPEALTGSTRLKAGTAQKLVLNMLSTASMIRIGKSYQNLMVDVRATNEKLQVRAQRMIMQACQCSREQAQAALTQANGEAKLAILLQLTGLSVDAARALLAQQQGRLSQALAQQN